MLRRLPLLLASAAALLSLTWLHFNRGIVTIVVPKWRGTAGLQPSYIVPGSTQLTIGSFNVRFDGHASRSPSRRVISAMKLRDAARRNITESNPKPRWGEVSWTTRRHKVADTVLFHDWDLFAFQEVLPSQLRDLVALLDGRPSPMPPGVPSLPSSDSWVYDWAGVPRNDGVAKGEAVPVFWKRELLERVDRNHGGTGTDGVNHFWLSPTPEVPGSLGWDADQTRMCTHVALQLKGTQQIIHVFSTHYDHLGAQARVKSSEMVLQKAHEAAAWSLAVQGESSHPALTILLGDLNSPRTEDGWRTLVSGHHGIHLAQAVVSSAGSDEFTFLDTALSVPTRFETSYSLSQDPDTAIASATREEIERSGGFLSEPFGPSTTFTGFEPSKRTPEEDCIDFIMIADNGAVLDESSRAERAAKSEWRIKTVGTVPNWSEGDAGFQVSDHRAIMTRIKRG